MLVETKVDEEFISKMNIFRSTVSGEGLLEACSKSVVVFAEKMLGLKLYSWQVDFLNRIQRSIEGSYHTREFVALTSRQIGKSTAVAVLALWACTFNKAPGTVRNNTIIGIVSASDVQAKKLLHDIELYMHQGDKYMKETYLDSDGNPLFGKRFFDALVDQKQANNTTTITFKDYNKDKHGLFLLKDSKAGSVIKSYPPTSVVLGETFTVVVVDEAGKTDRVDDTFFYDYIYPTGNSTNAIRIYTSTPWVPSGFFYRLADPNDDYDEHPADRVMYTVDAISIEAPEMRKTIQKTIDVMNLDGKTDEVQRAYYCRFVKGESCYFNPEKIQGMFDSNLSMVFGYKGECDLGVDFGGKEISKTVITISTLSEHGVVRLYHRVYEVGKDMSLLDDIQELMTRFNIQRVIPDDCPAGWYFIRLMIEKGWNVQPMNFKSEKVKKYGAFRATLNRGDIKSYKDDALKTEMLALEFNNGQKNSYIQHAPGYNDDIIDSFVMSTYFYVVDEDGWRYYDIDDYSEDDL